MSRYATIIATGSYLPPMKSPNADLAEKFGEVVGKFEASGGITTRFYAPEDWVTSDLAVEAGKAALAGCRDQAGRPRPDHPGHRQPRLHHPGHLGGRAAQTGRAQGRHLRCGCACASFPTGLNLAAGLIATNPHLKYVMVIGAYMMHKLSDWQNDVMSFFYGDGAGAAILTGCSKPGFVSSTFFADGSYHEQLGHLFRRHRRTGHARIRAGRPHPGAPGHALPGHGQQRRLACCACANWPRNGNFDLQEVDMVIYHPGAPQHHQAGQETLGLPIEKAHWIMDKWGYTGSACLPMCFDDARKQGRVKSGDLVAFVGSGVGYNQAGSAFIMP